MSPGVFWNLVWTCIHKAKCCTSSIEGIFPSLLRKTVSHKRVIDCNYVLNNETEQQNGYKLIPSTYFHTFSYSSKSNPTFYLFSCLHTHISFYPWYRPISTNPCSPNFHPLAFLQALSENVFYWLCFFWIQQKFWY